MVKLVKNIGFIYFILFGGGGGGRESRTAMSTVININNKHNGNRERKKCVLITSGWSNILLSDFQFRFLQQTIEAQTKQESIDQDKTIMEYDSHSRNITKLFKKRNKHLILLFQFNEINSFNRISSCVNMVTLNSMLK